MSAREVRVSVLSVWVSVVSVTPTTTGSLTATTAPSVQSNTTGHGSNDVMMHTMPASASLNAMMLPTADAQRNLMMFMQMQQQQQQFLMQMMFMNYHKNT